MKRIILYSHLDAPLGDLSTNDVLSCVRREEINGEHSLEITTTQVLEKGWRIIYSDDRGYWREYVVAGVDENHSAGRTVIGTYYCVWSVQQDLQGVTVSLMPGVQTPVSAGTALQAILSTQARWTYGTVTNMNTGGASMYDMNAWNAIGVLIDNWGGELSTSFAVSDNTGIVTRSVDLYAQMGEQTPYRRFDFGADLKSIRRIMEDAPLYCRISPRGKGEATEGGGYGRKITIESVNDGKDWLEYSPMVDVAKIPNGSSGYIYPTLIVENSSCETPADLKAWAEGVLASYCTPKVTYEVDVIQAAREGVDVQGVSLGDAVDVVDRKFREDGLRLTGRVVSMTVDEMTGKSVTVEIGTLQENIASKFDNSAGIEALEAVNALAGSLSTSAYIDSLLARINAEISADGGYTYIIPGNGIRTYDAEVSDPLIGAEASKVVEIKGGAIRIANSKTAQGAWEWKSVFTSGHIAADLVTAANIVAGYIGSSGGTFIDLDNNTVQLGDSTKSHVIIDQDSFDMYDGELSMGHFGGTAQTVGTQTYSGIYWTLGTRMSANQTNQGLYSFTAGVDNYAGRSSPGSATFGRGLYAAGTASPPSGYTGLVAGGYNVKGGSSYNVAGSEILSSSAAPTLLLVLGNGSDDSNRSNALEVDSNGNLGIKGQIVTGDGIGAYLSASQVSKSGVGTTAVELCTLELPQTSIHTVKNSIWIIDVSLGGTWNSNNTARKSFTLQRTYDNTSSPSWYDLKAIDFTGYHNSMTYICSIPSTYARSYFKLRVMGSYETLGQSGATGYVNASMRAIRIV